MITWLWITGAIYLGVLVFLTIVSRRKNRSTADYVLAGSNIGLFVGLLTYAATLFSAFTLMGMPDFFRTHGVGAWIFLAVSDGAQIFLIIWFGIPLRRRAKEMGFRGTASLLSALYENRWAGYIYLAGIFLFLVPYVAVQIRGLAIFLEAIYPGALPAWGWSVGIMIVMLAYGVLGGLRAVIAADAFQGVILLVATWIVGIACVHALGGVSSMFARVEAVDPALLSVPGPDGLFSIQFLLASFLAVMLLPATQPQLTTRLIIMRSTRTMKRMAVAIGCFVMLVLLPVVAIGMYGAVQYPEATTRDFLASVLLFDRPDVVAAVVVIGLLAAAMSTADSQIFALGTELTSLLSGDERTVLLASKAAIGVFGLFSLLFSLLSSDQLVLLALVSFAGTSLLGPMVLAGVFSRRPPGTVVLGATVLGLLIFLGSLVGVVPSQVGPMRLDLLLLLTIGAVTLASALYQHRHPKPAVAAERPYV
ncbi:MAG TPA: sodium:solute symporter family protein [Rhodothermales bacterium]|nr:sodium:solute symporter family protein [Rhodothermales bacterium]